MAFTGDIFDATANRSSDLVLDSLRRRMAAMHSLYYQAVASMDLEHVNHFEREGVLPIAFSLFHYTNMEDASFLLITGIPPVWNDEWQERVQMSIDDHGKHRTVDEMVHQRIGDYEAFKAYQRAVFDRTETYLAEIDPAEFARVVVERPFPPLVAVDLQRPGGGARGHHRARRLRVLALPARPAPHGRDRAGPRPRRPRRHDELSAAHGRPVGPAGRRSRGGPAPAGRGPCRR